MTPPAAFGVESMNVSNLETVGSTVMLESGVPALRLKCSGTYGIGCKGGPDARQICQTASQMLVSTGADFLLLDYSDLDYKWGDDLWHTFQIDHPKPDRELALAVVVGPDCETAIKSLLEDDGPLDSWLEYGFIFHSRSEALAHLSRISAEQTVADDRREDAAPAER